MLEITPIHVGFHQIWTPDDDTTCRASCTRKPAQLSCMYARHKVSFRMNPNFRSWLEKIQPAALVLYIKVRKNHTYLKVKYPSSQGSRSCSAKKTDQISSSFALGIQALSCCIHRSLPYCDQCNSNGDIKVLVDNVGNHPNPFRFSLDTDARR